MIGRDIKYDDIQQDGLHGVEANEVADIGIADHQRQQQDKDNQTGEGESSYTHESEGARRYKE
jgi:hypothetical protein